MITRWSFKSLLHARIRALGSTLAVAAAFLLVILFKAIWEGESQQLAAYIKDAGADVWVMQANVSNMHMATSFIPDGKRYEISAVPGVRSVSAILYVNTMLQTGRRRWFSYVVGVDTAGQMGGPWAITRGKNMPGPGEAIVPATLARISSMNIGDVIGIADHRFTVVGFSAETFSIANPITFVTARDLSELLSLRGYDGYVLVRSEPGISPPTLAAAIKQEVDGVEALPTDVFIANDVQLARQMGIQVIALMTAIGATLAALLVSFALYIHTSHVRRELAVLKALGFPNSHVYTSVLLQALILTGCAFGIAVVLSAVVALLSPAVLPVVTFRITARSIAQIGGAGVLIATAATLATARRVGHVDPLVVFKA